MLTRLLERATGFSLLEAVIATALVCVAILSGGRLLALTWRANQAATSAGVASLMAAQKMEQLRGLTWAFDSAGSPLADTSSDLTVEPSRSSGGSGLSPAPAAALEQNIQSYCDFLDLRGRSLGGGTTPPVGAAYVRRWAIAPTTADPNTLVLQVLVIRSRNLATGAAEITGASGRRLPDEARLITIKTRTRL
jgi:hypothetical protein